MQQNVNQSTGFEGEEDFAAMFEASVKERKKSLAVALPPA